MKNNIKFFAFEGNVSEAVLDRLLVLDKSLARSDVFVINSFVPKILNNKPTFIIGLGEYSGRDKDKLRIETICSNKFRNKTAGEKLETIRISEFLKTTKHSKLASGIGNSYCNLVSYLIAWQIRDAGLKTEYAFIHIPKGFNITLAATELKKMVDILV